VPAAGSFWKIARPLLCVSLYEPTKDQSAPNNYGIPDTSGGLGLIIEAS